ncbi:MAG: hypothetical protein OIF47_05085 [Marinibacterium sp.]|nr:hypothetical protein [Marinibacterium sp.]
MIKRLGKPLAIVAALALAACDDGTGGTVNIVSDISTLTSSGKSKEQRELSSRARAYASARVSAAAVGAVGGALICVVGGCNAGQTAAAAAVGGTAGYVGGAALTRQNAKFQVTQSSLNRDLQAAKRERKDLTAAVGSAQRVLNYQRAEVKKLNAAYRSGSLSKAQYKAQYRTMQQDVKATRTIASTGDKRVKELNSSISAHSKAGLNTSALRSERAAQQREVARLRSVERNMLGVLGAVPPEVKG